MFWHHHYPHCFSKLSYFLSNIHIYVGLLLRAKTRLNVQDKIYIYSNPNGMERSTRQLLPYYYFPFSNLRYYGEQRRARASWSGKWSLHMEEPRMSTIRSCSRPSMTDIHKHPPSEIQMNGIPTRIAVSSYCFHTGEVIYRNEVSEGRRDGLLNGLGWSAIILFSVREDDTIWI